MLAKDHLRHLLELAADPRPETRAALKTELEELLADWPDGDAAARAPFEALLKKVAHIEAPSLTELLRKGETEAAVAALAEAGGADADAVRHALAEESGAELAALCHAASVNRATYSDIAILAGPARGAELAVMKRVLDAFDAADVSNLKRIRFG